MNHPKNLLAICLLISCANTTNTVGHSTDDGGNKVEHKMVDIFDNAIGQFVEKFATKPESTSSSNDHNQQQPMHLTYRDVVHILKQIEEKVAQRITNAERKGYMFIMR
jgi:predicted small secreted protein